MPSSNPSRRTEYSKRPFPKVLTPIGFFFAMLLCVLFRVGRFMDQGKFVPDKIIFEVLVAAVERAKGEGKHILLDGFPRWGGLS